MAEEKAPVTGASTAGDEQNAGGKDFIDKVCDPCGLVPDNLEAALAHKKKMKQLKEDEEQAVKDAEAAAKISEEHKNTDDNADAVDSMLSNFNLDCCGNAPAPSEEVEVKEVPTEQILKNGENASVMTANNSVQTRSLADIAAKIDDIDLETAAEDTTKEQLRPEEPTKWSEPLPSPVWYKQPVYAILILLCGAFSIAIFVMAILLIVQRTKK
mmetsp:Transcript_18114/g.37162  ORF Transcript_18114/g.37162 Transcript_18114/m.37162 type:complete len:213 (-) Transcript_18114:169-807(-)|eukprot:CAMPEP_0201138582 /NCGR_PEP_ID=MMETSP0850-20130426/56002_1 /ASSEMBLY_ACC=CAM_ASM_000622 /TAXON_ID=183588 /ORGANISM="Pseudo-nitzschia fraudulenta, Strain WWA7" /LENGTH=212 /DNA_ID=CAMNT_0047409977 /DNA_START=1914 /DNA_END=2552 /DNA_ORIENTATION=-